MILTLALAVTLTVVIIAYAAERGRSPLAWGGASISISGFSILVAWACVEFIGATDMVFDRHGGAAAMVVVLAGPVIALLGNGALASRLAALPREGANMGSSWRMWRVGDGDREGCECRVSAQSDAIVGMLGEEELFRITAAHLAAVEVDGESLVLRGADGRHIRLLLADADPNDRSWRIQEISRVKRAVESIIRPA